MEDLFGFIHFSISFDCILPLNQAGPYNPNRYKDYFVPRTLPKNEEIVEFV